MHNLIDSFWILLVGSLGILLVIFIKIQDVTDSNPNIDFNQAWKLFFAKAKASYLASLTALLLYAITHGEWGKIFVGNALVSRILGMQMAMAFFVGGGMQWGIHKFFLKRVDGIMKIWCGDIKTGAPDVNTPVVNKEVEMAKSAVEKAN